MKIIVFSIDDGTVYDQHMIELMNKYGIKGTFNLNSGLDNFVWYLNDHPIKRFVLNEVKDLYAQHEVCAHSLTHPHLDYENDERLYREVFDDKRNLQEIFKRDIIGFATPFDTYNEHVVSVIQEAGFAYCRLPDKTSSFLHEEDNMHLKVNALTQEDDLFDILNDFLLDEHENGLCIIAGHSYEFEVNHSWDYLEQVFAFINNHKEFTSLTTHEALKTLKKL